MSEKKPEEYSRFSVNDFLLDASFQQWVQSPNLASDKFWNAFLQEYPHQEEILLEARDILITLHFKPHLLSASRKQQILDAVYDSVSQENGQKLRDAPFSGRKLHKVVRFRPYKKLAAVISAVLVITALVYWYRWQQELPTYATAYGEIKTFTLDDGTRVQLNANSSLVVHVDVNANHPREVWLDGEAYFEVAERTEVAEDRQAQKRFIVHTNDVQIEVLGTKFNVNSRKEKTQIVLNTGAVKVLSRDLKTSVVMQPGEIVELRKNDPTFRRNRGNTQSYTAWKEKIFFFENTPLRQVAEEIENYFGRRVIFEDPRLADEIFTATVPREDMMILLSLLEASFNIEIKKDSEAVRMKYKEK